MYFERKVLKCHTIVTIMLEWKDVSYNNVDYDIVGTKVDAEKPTR